MKRFNRILSLILCLVSLAGVSLFGASAEEVATGVTAGGVTYEVGAGDEVTYYIELNVPTNIENIQAVVYYDEEKLQPVDTGSATMFPELKKVSSVVYTLERPGFIKFNSTEGVDSGFDFTQGGVLAAITFKVLDPTASTLRYEIDDMVEFQGGDYVYNGSVIKEFEVKDYVEVKKYEPQEVQTGSLKITVVGGNGFDITVDEGKNRPQGTVYHNSKIPVGSKVKVVAKGDNEFIGWVNPANGLILTEALEYSFYTGGNDELRAMFHTPVEGANSVTFKNDKSNQILDMQYYCAEDEISFPNKTNYVGYDFMGWSMTEDEIKYRLSAGEDVVVVPVWEVQLVYVNLEVSGGEVIGHGGMNEDGQYLANKQTVVLANTPSEGEKFSHWEDGNGRIKSYDSEYTFYPATDVKLTAKYVAEDEVIDYKVLVNVDSCDTSGDYGTFNYNWFVPEAEKGYTFMAAGLVAVNKDNYSEATFFHGTTDTNVWDRAAANAESKGVYNWTGPVMSGQTWMAKAWVQYKDAEGNLCLEYSDLFEVTKLG